MGSEQVQGKPGSGSGPVSKLLSEPDLFRLLDYWRDKRKGRPMPAKNDIDPLEIPWALNRIFLASYSPQDGFRYRLAGAEVATVFGRSNLKDLTMSDILPPDRARFVEGRWMPLVEDRAMIVMKGMIYLAAERTPIGERLILPLADEADGPVTGAFGMTICKWLTGDVPQEVKVSQIEYVPVDRIP